MYKSMAVLLCFDLAAQTGMPRGAPDVRFENSPRVHELIRAGNLYLGLQDALALAIENNLDIELQRFALPQAGAELLRAKGGGLTRSLNFTLQEAPPAVPGPPTPPFPTPPPPRPPPPTPPP